MDFAEDRRHSSPGFPHSGILGSRPACGSPGLIAASYALRRLLMPGHPPYPLSSLTTHLLLTHMVCSRPIQLSKNEDFGAGNSPNPTSQKERAVGGAERSRTADPLLAKQMLSQLSYSPNPCERMRPNRTEAGGTAEYQLSDGGPR